MAVDAAVKMWRNGRRDRLKICYSKGCASSSLATGIKLYEEFMQFFNAKIFYIKNLSIKWKSKSFYARIHQRIFIRLL